MNHVTMHSSCMMVLSSLVCVGQEIISKSVRPSLHRLPLRMTLQHTYHETHIYIYMYLCNSLRLGFFYSQIGFGQGQFLSPMWLYIQQKHLCSNIARAQKLYFRVFFTHVPAAEAGNIMSIQHHMLHARLLCCTETIQDEFAAQNYTDLRNRRKKSAIAST